MYTCPECGREDIERRELCSCGADVSLLSAMESAVDAWHNAGMAAVAAADDARALEWFAACAAARPADPATLTVIAKLWLRLGHPEPALRWLDRAAELEPETSERSALRTLAITLRRDATHHTTHGGADPTTVGAATRHGNPESAPCKSAVDQL